MTAEELRDSLKTALANEREAIRRLDVAGVTRAAADKERMMAVLIKTTDPSLKAELVAVIGELKAELRRNLILLAHTRDCIRDAIEFHSDVARPRFEAKL